MRVVADEEGCLTSLPVTEDITLDTIDDVLGAVAERVDVVPATSRSEDVGDVYR